jgi:hypothetical protein
MERASCVWLKDEAQKGFAVSGILAREDTPLYNNYTECGDEKGSCHVLKGWFEIFERRMGMNNFKKMGDSASVFHMAGSYCRSYFPFRYCPLLDEIETEVKSDYQHSLRKAVLPYILPGLEERKRLKIETCHVDYPAIFIRAPVPWHCTFMASSQMLDHKLFIVNPILLCLRDLWEFQ